MKKALFTCVTGNYDFLFPPQNNTPGWDYICFTDNEKLQPGGWEVIPFEGTMSKVRMARHIKILMPELDDYDLTIWMDANFVITCDLNEHVARNHIPGKYSVMHHPNRKCFYEEAKACLRREKSHPDLIIEQMLQYNAEGMPRGTGLIASGIIIRENNEETKRINELWWEQLSRFSHRDQLGFAYIMWKYPEVKDNLHWSGYNYLSEVDFMYKPHMKDERTSN